MQKTWMMKELADGKRRFDRVQEDMAFAEAEKRRADMGIGIEKKAHDLTVSEQKSIIEAGRSQQKEASNYMNKMLKAPLDKLADIDTASEFVEMAKNDTALEVVKVADMRDVLLQNKMVALFARVSEQFQWFANKGNPKRDDRLKPSVFERITGAWDYDGSPIGPGEMESWNINAENTGLLHTHQGQTGFLNQKVVFSCSTACKLLSPPECSIGRIERSCSRGRVFRARFKQSDTVKNDFFVCRCNNGIMQFSAQESLSVVRHKNQLLRSRLTAGGLIFKKRLHQAELIPEQHVKCFVGFKPFLGDHMGNTTEGIELTAHKPAIASESIYDSARQQWYEKCLSEEDYASSKNQQIGSTDSSFDIVLLSSSSNDKAAKAQVEAMGRAKNAEEASLKSAAAQASAAKREEASGLASISVGDKTQQSINKDTQDVSSDDDSSPQLKAVKKATGKGMSAEETDELDIVANDEADEIIAAEANEHNPTNVINITAMAKSYSSGSDSSYSSSAIDSALSEDPCWAVKPGATFVSVQTLCGTTADKTSPWGQVINGERRPETQSAKLLSVVGPLGCMSHRTIGGEKATYWGGLTPADNVTVPCAPSGDQSSYLSPKGNATKVAIDMVRAAEEQEAREYAALLSSGLQGTLNASYYKQ
jgi:hypothetical protein